LPPGLRPSCLRKTPLLALQWIGCKVVRWGSSRRRWGRASIGRFPRGTAALIAANALV